MIAGTLSCLGDYHIYNIGIFTIDILIVRRISIMMMMVVVLTCFFLIILSMFCDSLTFFQTFVTPCKPIMATSFTGTSSFVYYNWTVCLL